jgi:hypothetical protein
MKFLSFLFTSVLLIPAVGMAGSISGGGGGTVPANPVGNAVIADILKESRSTLLMYFRSLDAGPGKWPTNEGDDRRLFGGSPSIYDVINETVIEAQSSAPCRDGDGNEVDGSIVTTNGGICISLQRLGAKLDRTNAFSQTVALVAHELSHKLGFNEDEATQLQKEMLDRLEENNVSARSAADFAQRVASRALNATQWAGRFEFLSDGDWDTACSYAKQLETQFEDYLQASNDARLPFSIVPRKQQAVYAFRSKVWGLLAATCAKATPPRYPNPEVIVLITWYQKAFTDRTELTVAEFQEAFWEPLRESVATTMKIQLIDSMSVAKTESSAIADHLSQILSAGLDIRTRSQVTIIP